MTEAILVINSGSSSIKFEVFEAVDQLTHIMSGRITEMNTDSPTFIVGSVTVKKYAHLLSHEQAISEITSYLQDVLHEFTLKCIGHRIVHGGTEFTAPTLLTAEVLTKLEALIPLARLHQPHALKVIRHLKELHPDTPQIACFDTAFHVGHDRIFSEYAIPAELTAKGVRRYGFHGLSYEWLTQVIAKEYPELRNSRIVAAHLGNGSSLCAIKDLKSVDTTMGMTALDGLPMGTRCGSIDPGAVLYMINELKMSSEEVEHTLTYDSGLLGLSGKSSSMKELVELDKRFTIEYYTMAVAQHIARMSVSIGGIDALIFTGGIGENHPKIRDAITAHIAHLMPFQVIVIPTEEERMIAMHCLALRGQ